MESKIFYNKTNGKFYKTIECESYDVFDCRKSVGIEEVIELADIESWELLNLVCKYKNEIKNYLDVDDALIECVETLIERVGGETITEELGIEIVDD